MKNSQVRLQNGYGGPKTKQVHDEIIRKLDKQSTPFIEFLCSRCDFRAMISFGGHQKGTIEEMCFMLLDQTKKNRTTHLAQENESSGSLKSKMTKKECNDFIKKIKSMNQVKMFKGEF